MAELLVKRPDSDDLNKEHRAMNKVIYIHDPMCSWCWAFAPRWVTICENLPAQVEVQTLLGGLAPDSDEAMPEQMQGFLQQTWRRIEGDVLGTKFNHDFWTLCSPRRSTWPACRAVVAAELLRAGAGSEMTSAIQHAYYLKARNPSDTSTLVELAIDLGLDEASFEALINSEENRARHMHQMAQSQELGVDSYPTLLLQTDERILRLPIDYNDADVTLRAIKSVIDVV